MSSASPFSKSRNTKAAPTASAAAGCIRLVVLGVPLMTFFDGTEGSVKLGGPIFNELLVEPNTVRMIQAFSNIRSREIRLSLVKLAEGMATKSRN